ncbi:MAG: hypothetical protein ACPGPI_03290 [Longimicrobiales bacterium]
MKVPHAPKVLLMGAMFWAAPAYGQTLAQLTSACVGAGGSARLCTGAAVGAQAFQSQVGLLAGTGVEVPGTATTLGTRVGGGPRLAFSVRAGLVDMTFPDLSDPLVTREGGSIATTIHGRVSAGLFEGIQLMPTVGGFLSLDVFGQASLLFLPEGEGLSEGARSYSAGIRVGVLREGFTVPGVSLSVAKRFPDDLARLSAGGPGGFELSSDVTSYRATVGKDLFAVEWLVGLGYEEYDGEVTIDVANTGEQGGRARVTGPVHSDRLMYFGGASTTFGIVLTLSVEAGWAEGFDAVSGWDGPHDPTSSTLFGGLSARLTL